MLTLNMTQYNYFNGEAWMQDKEELRLKAELDEIMKKMYKVVNAISNWI